MPSLPRQAVALTRGWSVFLAGFGVWSWVIWPTFLRNIARDPRSFSGHRPHAFFVVHAVLTVVSLVFGTAVGWLGVRGLRGRRRIDLDAPAGGVRPAGDAT